MVIRKDLTIYQGGTYEFTMRFKNSNGTAIDVSGWTFASQLRTSYVATSTEAEAAFDMTSASIGEVTFILTDEDTEAMSARKGVWDLEYEDEDGKVFKIFRGEYELLLEVTK